MSEETTLFKINPNYVISEFSDLHIIVDNVYENFEQVHKYLLSLCPDVNTTSNYYPVDSHRIRYKSDELVAMDKLISELSQKYWGVDNVPYDDVRIFKILAAKHHNIPNDRQKWVHIDDYVTGILHIDKIASGGTAIFSPDTPITTLTKKRQKRELHLIPRDKLVTVLRAKPNRLVLARTTNPHCVYVEDYEKYFGKYRMTQIFFTKTI